MATPFPPPPPPSPPPPGAPGSVDHGNLVSFFGATRTITKVWVLIGALVALLSLLSIVLSLLVLHFPGGGIGGLVYAILWIGVDLLMLDRMGGWASQLAEGRYSALKEPLLLWGILSLIFGVVPGVMVLVVYARLLPWADRPAGFAEPPIPAGAAGPAAPGPFPPGSP